MGHILYWKTKGEDSQPFVLVFLMIIMQGTTKCAQNKVILSKRSSSTLEALEKWEGILDKLWELHEPCGFIISYVSLDVFIIHEDGSSNPHP